MDYGFRFGEVEVYAELDPVFVVNVSRTLIR